MAFFNKLNDLAKNIGDRTSDALETGKLTAKIHSERKAAEEDIKKIGEHYYQFFMAGGEVPAELTEIFQSAKAHYETADAAQQEIDSIKAENEAEKTAAREAREAAKEEAPIPVPVPVSEPISETTPAEDPTEESAAESIAKKRFCSNCGTPASEGTRFCAECGTKLE